MLKKLKKRKLRFFGVSLAGSSDKQDKEMINRCRTVETLFVSKKDPTSHVTFATNIGAESEWPQMGQI